MLRINTRQEADFQNLQSLLRQTLPVPDVDVWREPSTSMRSADVYVKYHELSIITGALQDNGFTFHTFIEDVQKFVFIITNN